VLTSLSSQSSNEKELTTAFTYSLFILRILWRQKFI